MGIVSGMQLIMKVISREPPPGKKVNLTLEDAVLWIDWVVTAGVALALTLLSATARGEASVDVLVGLLFVCVVGMLVVPVLVRVLCYDGTGGIKGWSYVVLADLAGMMVLLVSVTTGVNIYGA
ncbi:hypothetical protein OG883_05595 [Streptomyces sp. NBC_01142]|uniref:hypothetical protein n=1 Tax=Streptomyces sp. NBC_01142 TaxID=2975865 RepID=UPI00224DADF8|nr:hypothetical protein [Streptomyces sp. NBC_01142]MCX4819387.1 hypothetical protein [Streptomyces sp. NBC_01142]